MAVHLFICLSFYFLCRFALLMFLLLFRLCVLQTENTVRFCFVITYFIPPSADFLHLPMLT
jgi:hypothetical protein